MLSKINKYFFPRYKEVNQVFSYIRGDISIESCSKIIEDIIAINYPTFSETEDGLTISDVKPDVINLLITSGGGDMSSAFGLINVMRGSKIPVRTIALGEASSAGLCLLMAGHQRVVTPYTSLMSHSFSSGAEGTFQDIKNVMTEMDRYYEKMLKFYAECTSLNPKFIKNQLLGSTDHYFDPDTAVKYHMVDLISDLS